MAEGEEVKTCEECGAAFTKPRKYSWKQWEEKRFCSMACGVSSWSNPGAVRYYRDGRAYVRDRNRRGVYWARIVMEDMRGGDPLPPGSVVHHKNGDCTDDRPENLQLLASQSDHRALHIGDASSSKRLSGTQVRDMRQRFAASSLGPWAFAARVKNKYPVDESSIVNVLQGKTWDAPEYWP